MHPHRKIVFRHSLKYGPKLWASEWLAGNVGKDLHTTGAEFANGTINLSECRIDIIHWQRRDKRRKIPRIFRAELGERIISDPPS